MKINFEALFGTEKSKFIHGIKQDDNTTNWEIAISDNYCTHVYNFIGSNDLSIHTVSELIKAALDKDYEETKNS